MLSTDGSLFLQVKLELVVVGIAVDFCRTLSRTIRCSPYATRDTSHPGYSVRVELCHGVALA